MTRLPGSGRCCQQHPGKPNKLFHPEILSPNLPMQNEASMGVLRNSRSDNMINIIAAAAIVVDFSSAWA